MHDSDLETRWWYDVERPMQSASPEDHDVQRRHCLSPLTTCPHDSHVKCSTLKGIQQNMDFLSSAAAEEHSPQCRPTFVNSNTSHTACTDAHTLSAHHIALIPRTTSVAQGQPDCVPKIVVSFHLSRAMSLAPHRTPSTSSSTFSSAPGLPRLVTSRNPSADSRERGVMDILIQDISLVMSPTGSSTTRSLMNRRIVPTLKTIRLPKLRVMSKLCPTTSHCCTQDSIESIATHQEADLDDEQIRALLASPRYLPEREASAERSHLKV